MARQVTGYSTTQVALHWAVVALVAFQYLAHSGIENRWFAIQTGRPSPDDVILSNMHVVAGILVLVLIVTRIYLRITRGVPPPPANEPWILKLVADGVHYALYLLLLLLPLSGVAAWFFEVEAAASAHRLFKTLLLAAVALHIGGALFQHFLLRSEVLIRMFRPDAS